MEFKSEAHKRPELIASDPGDLELPEELEELQRLRRYQ